MFFIEDKNAGELIQAPKNEYLSGLVYHVTVDEWHHLLPALYNHGDMISLDNDMKSFSEELYHHLETLPDYFSKETIQIYRTDRLIFSSNRSEKKALVDLSYISQQETILPQHHPIIRSYHQYTSDYNQAKKQGKLYSPDSLNCEEFKTLLNKLFARCDDLCLVTNSDSVPIQNGKIGYIPEYPGKYERSNYTAYHYSFSEDLYNIFLSASSFFSFGENNDIVFSRKKKTVLYTDSSRKLCVIDPWFLEETIGSMKTRSGTILTEELVATLMNTHGIASREEFEKTL